MSIKLEQISLKKGKKNYMFINSFKTAPFDFIEKNNGRKS